MTEADSNVIDTPARAEEQTAGVPQTRRAAGLDLGGPIDAYEGDPNFMLSLARGMVVVKALVDECRALTVTEASRITGLSRATVRRCFYTLEKLGLVVAEGPTFTLGPPVMAMGQAYLMTVGPLGAIQAVLNRLRDRLDETCALARLHGQDIVYIASARATHSLSVAGQPGTNIPAYCTSLGRVLLAHLSRTEIESILAHMRPVSFTPYTLTDVQQIRVAVDHARAAGYSINDQELDLGVRGIAVPVRDRSGRVVAALNAGGDPSRLKNALLLSRFLPEMKAAAREIGLLIDAL